MTENENYRIKSILLDDLFTDINLKIRNQMRRSWQQKAPISQKKRADIDHYWNLKIGED